MFAGHMDLDKIALIHLESVRNEKHSEHHETHWIAQTSIN